MSVSVASDKRFRRAHVPPARRGARTSRMAALRLVLVVGAVVAALYQAAGLVLTTGALSIRHISVDGNTRMSRGAIAAVLEELDGASILTVDLEAWRQRLRRLPWVADARVRRIFPSDSGRGGGARAIAAARSGTSCPCGPHGTIIEEFGPGYARWICRSSTDCRRGHARLMRWTHTRGPGGPLAALARTQSHLVKRISQIASPIRATRP